LAPLCIFSAGAEDNTSDHAAELPWLRYFNQAPGIELLLNLMMGRLLKHTDQVNLLQKLNVPIIQLLRSYSQTPEQWQLDPQGLPAITAVFSFAQPELFGAIAPMVVAGTMPIQPGDPAHVLRTFIPIDERIETLCRRVRRWVRLRRLANSEKRITIILHNNPCKGVEATVGLASGLDTFDSLALVLKKMKAAGYHVENVPEKGSDIIDMIMERKAVAEFRWTTVDEIITKGGALYMMDADEYLPWFNQLPETARNKVLKDWGPFPGESMAYEHNGKKVLVVTGIQYGHIRVMAQPKRGCYGPKCTGEVCRILHDPTLAPPHQWLGTYKYIQENSDAVIHFGTEGALEFLPGKQSGLSEACFPEISIGDLPNLYIYSMDVTGEGLTAKRRGQAVLVDHMTPVYRPTPLDDKTRQLLDLMEQYHKAKNMAETGRCDFIGQQIAPLLKECGLTQTVPDKERLPRVLATARRKISRIEQALMPEGLHLLSVPPEADGVARLLATMLQSPPQGLPDTDEIAVWVKDDTFTFGHSEFFPTSYDRAVSVLQNLLTGCDMDPSREEFAVLDKYCKDVADRVARCTVEISHLLCGLNGRFIPPGLSGSLSQGKIDALPTGRNFFATDITTLPTLAAWKIGKQMAAKLLLKYLEEEDRFPESIGISIWSSDAFKSDGELLSQIFALMGAMPVWDNQNKVAKTVPIDLEALVIEMPDGSRRPRPRVDITIQTSSIMRDLVPNFCELLDQTVTMLSRLEEPLDRNFIRKHTIEQIDQLRLQTKEELSDKQIRRMATFRVFSTAPGTYSLGVGLALDASAWQDAKDLAEIYINQGGYAYGADRKGATLDYGHAAMRLFADQLARLDVTYMKQSSVEYDVLDCSCYAVAFGGMAAATKAIGKKGPKLYWGDSTVASNMEVCDLADEVGKSARVKLLNPTWFQHMRGHGFKGAQSVASRVNNLFKWSATSGQVSKQLFDEVVRTYILNEENRQWLREINPYALEEITRRLLEAQSRGLWQADEDLLGEVKLAALEIEGDMEELMGEVKEEFQGNKVEVLTAKDVEKWKLDFRIEDK
jgi:cobaltochelatase CobN